MRTNGLHFLDLVRQHFTGLGYRCLDEHLPDFGGILLYLERVRGDQEAAYYLFKLMGFVAASSLSFISLISSVEVPMNNKKIASCILVALTLVFAACSNLDRDTSRRRVLEVNATSTPTATAPVLGVVGVQMEDTPVWRLYPTRTPAPLIEIIPDTDLFPWLNSPDLHWFPLVVP